MCRKWLLRHFLTRHNRMHMEKKPYKCCFCGRVNYLIFTITSVFSSGGSKWLPLPLTKKSHFVVNFETKKSHFEVDFQKVGIPKKVNWGPSLKKYLKMYVPLPLILKLSHQLPQDGALYEKYWLKSIYSIYTKENRTVKYQKWKCTAKQLNTWILCFI